MYLVREKGIGPEHEGLAAMWRQCKGTPDGTCCRLAHAQANCHLARVPMHCMFRRCMFTPCLQCRHDHPFELFIVDIGWVAGTWCTNRPLLQCSAKQRRYLPTFRLVTAKCSTVDRFDLPGSAHARMMFSRKARPCVIGCVALAGGRQIGTRFRQRLLTPDGVVLPMRKTGRQTTCLRPSA
jgi:hypothetical protein